MSKSCFSSCDRQFYLSSILTCGDAREHRNTLLLPGYQDVLPGVILSAFNFICPSQWAVLNCCTGMPRCRETWNNQIYVRTYTFGLYIRLTNTLSCLCLGHTLISRPCLSTPLSLLSPPTLCFA